MPKIGLPKGSRKRSKSGKRQGILKWILSGNPASFQWRLKTGSEDDPEGVRLNPHSLPPGFKYPMKMK